MTRATSAPTNSKTTTRKIITTEPSTTATTTTTTVVSSSEGHPNNNNKNSIDKKMINPSDFVLTTTSSTSLLPTSTSSSSFSYPTVPEQLSSSSSSSFSITFSLPVVAVTSLACIVAGATIGSFVTIRTIRKNSTMSSVTTTTSSAVGTNSRTWRKYVREIIVRPFVRYSAGDATITTTNIPKQQQQQQQQFTGTASALPPGSLLSTFGTIRSLSSSSILSTYSTSANKSTSTTTNTNNNNNNTINNDSTPSSPPQNPSTHNNNNNGSNNPAGPYNNNNNNTDKSTNEKLLSPALQYAMDCRRLLPSTIVLIRHGESMANADPSIWKRAPDNLIGLTEQGKEQAVTVGKRVRNILYDTNSGAGNDQQQHTDGTPPVKRVHLVVSPFERTQQTAAIVRQEFEECIVRTDIESRIREQEMGNIQGDEFIHYRQQQEQIGRFFYRFPTGESGADVFDRVKSWWYESVLPVNLRIGYEPIDTIIVITHGLTMRFILMQLFNWSPTTFHSVYNASNCEMYVLQKDLDKPGISPYVLDTERGDMPRSSIDLEIQKIDGTHHTVQLLHYLNVPPPRTMQIDLIRRMVVQQHPHIFPTTHDIQSITFLPFVKCDDEIIIQNLAIPAGRRKNYNTDNYSTISTKQQQQQQQQQHNHLGYNHTNIGATIYFDNNDTTYCNDTNDNKNNNNTNESSISFSSLASSGSSSVSSTRPTTAGHTHNRRHHAMEQSHRFPYLTLASTEYPIISKSAAASSSTLLNDPTNTTTTTTTTTTTNDTTTITPNADTAEVTDTAQSHDGTNITDTADSSKCNK